VISFGENKNEDLLNYLINNYLSVFFI